MAIVIHTDHKNRIRVHYDDAPVIPPRRFLVWVGVGGTSTVVSDTNESPGDTWQLVLIKVGVLREQAKKEFHLADGFADVFAGDVQPTLEQYQDRYRDWIIGELWHIARNGKEQQARVDALALLAKLYGLDAPRRMRTELKVTR